MAQINKTGNYNSASKLTLPHKDQEDEKANVNARTLENWANNLFPPGGTSGQALLATGSGGGQGTGMVWETPTVTVPTRMFYNTITSGDATLGYTGSTFTIIGGGFDLLVTGVTTGDILLVGASGAISGGTSSAGNIEFDVATMVSASPVNWVGDSGGSTSNTGIAAWLTDAPSVSTVPNVTIGAPIPYTVQASDISGGNVLLQLYYGITNVAAAGRRLFADSTTPFILWAMNTSI